ncbi:uncharacterized protein LOC128736195 [Sabethes cyaneus]|uniref:uncharacterized protein LOC128736195 n=1 Tax=Sabethes cyaneus TaxID=53552 RepID=UPI00237EBB90|nr:uncharacterized protein LOC128736195 [Sabethes cyaneus]
MEINEYASIQLPEQTNLPFAISGSGEYYVVSAKGGIQVLQLKYKHIKEDSTINYNLSRLECSKSKPTGQLLTKEIDLYNNSNREQRIKIMLDQTVIPNIATLYINNILANVSPPGIFADYNVCLVAHLTNLGQLTLHRYNREAAEWGTYLDISTLWVAHLYDGNIINRYDRLEPMVKEVLITTFCWRDQTFRQVAHLAVGTKSGKVAICSLYSDNVRIEHVIKLSDAVRVLKWITISEDRNLLLVGLLNGKIAALSFHTQSDATVTDFVKLNDVWNDEDYLTASNIQYEIDQVNQRILVLVVKGTHLLAFLCSFNGEISTVAIQNLNSFMITGTIFCCHIKTIKTNQIVIDLSTMKTDLPISKFSIYGVTATSNRACWMFVGYPSKSFDRLSLRTPTVVFFCRISGREPLKILLENPSLRLTEYYDCAEVIRYSGNRDTQTLKELEALSSTRARVDDAYAYHLKLQLIQLGAKFSYFKKRCLSIADILCNQSQFVATVIEILHAAKVIYYFLYIRQTFNLQLSYMQLLSVRCLRNFMRDFVEDSFPGDFEHVHIALKPVMEEVIGHANEILSGASQKPLQEECTFCGERIAYEKQTCSESHQTFRCSLTKQQIPVQKVETVCEMCDRSSLDVELLAEIFYTDGGHLSVYYRTFPCTTATVACVIGLEDGANVLIDEQIAPADSPHTVTDSTYSGCAPTGSGPGRTDLSKLEAPNPLITVVPLQPAIISRPGPVYEYGEGVFQLASMGKYNSIDCNSTPDFPEPSRHSHANPHQLDYDAAGLRILYQNVRGLRTKIDEFFLAATECDYDVMVLTETWLDDHIHSVQLFGNLFNVYRCDRNRNNSNKTRGGGVLIAVSTRLISFVHPTPVCDTIEQLWVIITTPIRKINVGVMYLPPDRRNDVNAIELHVCSISSIMSRLQSADFSLLLGDYNQPGLRWIRSNNNVPAIDYLHSNISPASSGLLDGFNLHGLTQINYVTNSNDRLLDLVLTNNVTLCELFEAVEPLVPLDSNHPALIITVHQTLPVQFEDTPVETCLDFRRADFDSISIAISQIDWRFLELNPALDDAITVAQTTVV